MWASLGLGEAGRPESLFDSQLDRLAGAAELEVEESVPIGSLGLRFMLIDFTFPLSDFGEWELSSPFHRKCADGHFLQIKGDDGRAALQLRKRDVSPTNGLVSCAQIYSAARIYLVSLAARLRYFPGNCFANRLCKRAGQGG